MRRLCTFHFKGMPELDFLKRLWGLVTEEEEGFRTGPPGNIGWRNSFLGIDSGAPYPFKSTGSDLCGDTIRVGCVQSKTLQCTTPTKAVNREDKRSRCSTTGKPTRSFATERVSLDSV